MSYLSTIKKRFNSTKSVQRYLVFPLISLMLPAVLFLPVYAQVPYAIVETKPVQSNNTDNTLKIIDISERQIDGYSALSVLFSAPLQTDQRFAEKLLLVDAEKGNLEGAWILSDNQKELIFSHLEPKRKLVLTIEAGILATNGQSLTQKSVHTLETQDRQPMLGFASRGSLFPARLAEGLPVMALNVNKATIDFFRIKENQLPAFLRNWDRNNTLASWQSKELLQMTDLIYSATFDLNVEKNKRENVLLPIGSIDALQQSGVYFAVMRESGTYDYSYPATYFTVSDIGVSVHRYKANNNLRVFSQDLTNGAIIADAKLQLFNAEGQIIAEGKTDLNGQGEIANSEKGEVLLVSQGNNVTLLRLKTAALDLSEFKVAGDESKPYQFFLFGPRDLYRPGETVLLNGLFRNQDGHLVDNVPVTLIIRRPDGTEINQFVWQAHQAGFYQYQLVIPKDAQTGRWSFIVKVGDRVIRDATINIEEFLPERLALQLSGLERPLVPTEGLKIDVEGRYLYGAPANGNVLSGQIYIHPLREAVSQLPDYMFGNILENPPVKQLDIEQKALNEKGIGVITAASQWKEIKSPLQLIVQASLQESGGRPIVRSIIQSVWPAKSLIGIRSLFKNNVVADNTHAEFEVVKATAQGEKQAANNLNVRFIYERRDYYWFYSSSDGWNSNYSQKDIVMNEQKLNINAGSIANISFPVEWGYYRVEIEDPVTGLMTSSRFRAGYDWQESTMEGNAIRPDQIKITLDKPDYKNGDIAKVTLIPPAAGSGYFMVESAEGPLWMQPISLPAEGKVIEIPVAKAWQSHDIYFSAFVIRPGERKLGVTPKRAVGILHLPLSRKERQLALALNAPQKIRPRQDLTIKINAKTSTGEIPKHVNVLVSTVDAGILNITDFKTPDPFASFFTAKAYGADLLDVYGQLIEAGQGRLASLSFGGDAALTPGGKRPNIAVNLVALQSQPVMLNEQGDGEVILSIPDFNGELRLMAQAWNADMFGAVESKTTVAEPVIAELSTPRFLASGDTTTVSLDINNLTSLPQQLTMNLHAEGLIRLTETKTASLQLAAGERQSINIPLEALVGIGHGKLRVTVDGIQTEENGENLLQREWTLAVRSAYPAKVETLQNILQQESWQIPQATMANIELTGREGVLRLSSYPPLNLTAQIEALNAYPYGCAEQTASGLYPSLYASRDLLKRLRINTDQTDEQRHQAIKTGIERLMGMQRYDGSFGLWNSNGPEEYWLTVYITDFLLRAQERGFAVSAVALEKATNRLLTYLQNSNTIENYAPEYLQQSRFAVQAYAGYVLSRSGQAPLGVLRTLYERRDIAPSGLSLLQLSIALQKMGDVKRAETLLMLSLSQKRVADNQSWQIGDYGSQIRDDAMMAALLQEYHLLPEETFQRLIRLNQDVMIQKWLSTQERNAIFLAGYQSISMPEKPWQVDVAVADKHYTLSDTEPSLRFSEADLAAINTLTISSKTPNLPLYQSLNLSGFPQLTTQNTAMLPPVVSKEAQTAQLVINKRYLSPSGNPLDLKHVKSGDLVVVWLQIASKQRIPDALIVDLLPAGFEIENQNLASASASLEQASNQFTQTLDSMRTARILHQESRDDRYVAQVDVAYDKPTVDLLYLVRAVTPGHYTVAPATIESMYNPNLQAMSHEKTTSVTITEAQAQ